MHRVVDKGEGAPAPNPPPPPSLATPLISTEQKHLEASDFSGQCLLTQSIAIKSSFIMHLRSPSPNEATLKWCHSWVFEVSGATVAV